MTVPTPSAGQSHTVVFRYSNDTKTIGMMIPDMRAYSKQPYVPFAPQTRQGEATQRDFSITSVWEIENDWSGGTGHLIEDTTTETMRYGFSQGRDLSGTTSIGACLFTGQKGRLYPAPAETMVTVSGTPLTNVKGFIEFNGKWYAGTSDAAGKIYEYNGTTTWTLRETLTNGFSSFFTDGITLFACQGASTAVRKTTDGTTWSNHTFNAHFMCKREEGNTAYVTTNTLTLLTDGTGPSFRAASVDLSGTTVTGLVYWAGKLWIGKPESLMTWEQGWFNRVEDCKDCRDTSNFSKMVVHKGLLYYNIKNKLYFTNGDRRTEILPEDINGFTAIDSIFATAGPLLLGLRMQSRSYLMYFAGVDAPGLNPLWSDADGTRPVVACGATDLYGTAPRIFFSQTTTGTGYLDFKQNWVPNTYHTYGTTPAYIELTTFSAGFRSVPKWFYEVVLNIVDQTADTVIQIWYSIDEGAWTQTLDNAGTISTWTAGQANIGSYFPLNARGVNIRIRLYVYTLTGTNAQAAITAVTIRGNVEPKKRVQISFPVSADETVQGENALAQDSGRNIKAAFDEMITSGYPFKFQDYDKSWYLCEFRTPYPLEAITTLKHPQGNRPAEALRRYNVLLTVIDTLDSSGSYNSWTAG